ncbi:MULTISPECIES: methyltransferase domain-containing protein [Bacillaceae]|uniref:Methyltransferase domain-containing protein n=1 Tax=Mesobacillus jeotgali TaxID=129985 RepID=A0ABY9VAK9_9BACI|nr:MULTISPECIES: methyltransferase domain-containing protein [Bacillaceae]WNF20923.1 methyltransferase domain-containing protein [Mesobacillus jeotgali]
MKQELNEKIKKRYNRVSKIYDRMDRMIREDWRRDLLAGAYGDVMEAGVGTGANLSFYPNNIQSLIGVDFSSDMLKYAKQKASQLNASYKMELIEGDIQELPFPDNSFDTVVSTCVFCSVPDPIVGLEELRRVCKPDGQILMLEHMRSENQAAGLVMDILNPITVGMWGANINRETMANIKSAGLSVVGEERLMGSIMRRLLLSPNK